MCGRGRRIRCGCGEWGDAGSDKVAGRSTLSVDEAGSSLWCKGVSTMTSQTVYTLRTNLNTHEWLHLPMEPRETIIERTEALDGQFCGKPVPRPFVYPILERDATAAPKPLDDMPCSIPGVILFSERAAEAMRPLIDHCGEFLPMDWAEGRLVAFNVCPLMDAIDFGRCKADPAPSGKCWLPGTRPDLAFRDEVIERVPIFKVPQYTGSAFVTEAFKQHWEGAGLVGAKFERVWPWPPEQRRFW